MEFLENFKFQNCLQLDYNRKNKFLFDFDAKLKQNYNMKLEKPVLLFLL